LLVGGFGNDRDDSALAQVAADRAGGVRLVTPHPVGTGTRPSRTATSHPQVTHQDGEHRRVTGLPRPDQHHQGQATPIDEVVDLGA